MKPLDDLLSTGLRLVVCGAAAGRVSAERRQYYAGPGNVFWPTLARIGLTPRSLEPAEYKELLQYGIGLTDIVKNQVGRDEQVEFLKSGSRVLREKIEKCQPKVLAFNGKKAAEVYFDRTGVAYGVQPERVGETLIFVAPSTSGAARGSWNPSLWQQLADLVIDGTTDSRAESSPENRPQSWKESLKKSGLELLFRTAINYERTHQIALYTLFQHSNLGRVLLQKNVGSHVQWEPVRGRFDLAVTGGSRDVYVELKMWSELTEAQKLRQMDLLVKEDADAVYVLLGFAGFEHDQKYLDKVFKGRARRIGYEELLASLDEVLASNVRESDVLQLASAYRDAVAEQWRQIREVNLGPERNGQARVYSIYASLKASLPNLELLLYRVTHPGGPVLIMNNQKWLRVERSGQSSILCYELVDGRLCIKCGGDEIPKQARKTVRDAVWRASKEILSSGFKLEPGNGLGRYMTAAQLAHDFLDCSQREKSIAIMQELHEALPTIESRVGSF